MMRQINSLMLIILTLFLTKAAFSQEFNATQAQEIKQIVSSGKGPKDEE